MPEFVTVDISCPVTLGCNVKYYFVLNYFHFKQNAFKGIN